MSVAENYEEMETDSVDAMVTSPSTADEPSPSPTPKSNKRKRESDSHRTPSRPKAARTAKRITEPQQDEEERWYAEQANNAPVPLPLSVVSLFRRPHVFPTANNDEILKNYGVKPQVFYKTATNTATIADRLNRTPDVIVRKLREREKRTELDDEYEKEQTAAGNMGAVSHPRASVEEKPDGSLVVLRRDRPPAKFSQVSVRVTKLNDSLVKPRRSTEIHGVANNNSSDSE